MLLPILPDANMVTALKWADEMGPAPKLPEELGAVSMRVSLVEDFERKVMAEYLLGKLVTRNRLKDQFHRLDQSEKEEILRIIGSLTEQYMPGITEKERTGIALRMWAGCVAAGKTIAFETRDGTNTEKLREDIFAQSIDPTARRDPIFRAGVEAAPRWKSGRNQGVSYGGVPPDSSVRKYSG